MENYEILLTSYDDFDDFVVEIWLKDHLIAIVNEKDEVQLFDDKTNKSIFGSCEFLSVLEKARKKLNIV